MRTSQRFIPILIAVLVFGYGTKNMFAETSPSVLYVPLIGITSVPDPLALPKGPGNVTYNYAVKNFLKEVALTDVKVTDDKCTTITFLNGDDNGDSKLDYNETWRYACTTKLSATTQSTATVTGSANGITATHTAHATVVVGSGNVPPLVSIINITKVAYPLTLPAEGGTITFVYRVNNPGLVPLSFVTVTDDKCSAMSTKLGDTNGNNLLDINELWIYTCTTTLTQTTTNTVNVKAFANGLEASGEATITVRVGNPVAQISPKFPDTGPDPILKVAAWGALLGILTALLTFFVLTRRRSKNSKKFKHLVLPITISVLVGVAVGAGFYYLVLPHLRLSKAGNTLGDTLFGWKFPVVKFPMVGPTGEQIAYSNIRDPGGIPQGLPIRLQIPKIGVDSAIEDALITPDGRMDVPAGSVNVAWFSLGPFPGREGSAVIGGHFGINNGVPFVFYNLDKLRVGDKIYVLNDEGNTLAFVVKNTKSFDRNADATTVFTSEDGLAHLNLITCEGIWNQVNNTYPQRLVVFADAIAPEGAVAVPPKLPSTALSPTPTPTPTPRLVPSPSGTPPILTPTPSPEMVIVRSAKSVSGTLVDQLVTSLLLVAIVFVVYKIIRLWI